MLRLVWKDVVVARWFLLAGLPLYVIQVAGMASVVPAHVFVIAFFTAVLAFGPIGVEEIQGTEALWASLPVGRRNVVLARYAATAIGIAFGLGTGWAVARASAAWIFSDARNAPDLLGAGAYASLAAVFLLFAALFLPCYFRLGAGRALTVASLLTLGLLVLLSLAGSLAVHLVGGADVLEAMRRQDPARLQAVRDWLDRWGGLLAAGLVGAAAALFAVSALVAIVFYERRDL